MMGLDFQLPTRLEARQPPEARGLARDQVRLLADGRHLLFRDLPQVLEPGDLIVYNDSATLPAAVGQIHFSAQLAPDLWVVEPRGPDHTLPETSLELLGPYRGSQRLQLARVRVDLDYFQRFGRPIRYAYLEGEWALPYYQTIFARHPGSAEMPSAGRAFTPALLARLILKGVSLSPLTLHTGVSSLENPEPPYPEFYSVPKRTLEAARRARRVIAVGTTVVRALESAHLGPLSGWTELVITPDRPLALVDDLLTGFHEPKASHLAMLEAVAGRQTLARDYATAIEHGYLWHEFGDLHLVRGRP